MVFDVLQMQCVHANVEVLVVTLHRNWQQYSNAILVALKPNYAPTVNLFTFSRTFYIICKQLLNLLVLMQHIQLFQFF